MRAVLGEFVSILGFDVVTAFSSGPLAHAGYAFIKGI